MLTTSFLTAAVAITGKSHKFYVFILFRNKVKRDNRWTKSLDQGSVKAAVSVGSFVS